MIVPLWKVRGSLENTCAWFSDFEQARRLANRLGVDVEPMTQGDLLHLYMAIGEKVAEDRVALLEPY